jgi:hypothetical protein
MVLTWSALAAKADDDDGKVTGGDSLRPSRSKPAMRWFSLQRAQDTLLSIPWHFLCATLPPSPTQMALADSYLHNDGRMDPDNAVPRLLLNKVRAVLKLVVRRGAHRAGRSPRQGHTGLLPLVGGPLSSTPLPSGSCK